MIVGKKVGLSAIEEKDLGLLKEWRNSPFLRKHFRESMELNMHQQKQWWLKVTESKNDFMFLITELETHTPIGVAGLTYINWILRSSEISLYIGKDEVYIDNDGLAEEALQLITKYGFETLNLNKVWTELYEFDDKKITLYKKCGILQDGVLRDNCFHNNRFYDSYLVALLRRDYVSRLEK